jgi:cell division protein FtsB
MNPFEMVVLIVAIVMFAGVFKARYGHRNRDLEEADPASRIENQQLRDEVAELKERIKVLERITVEKENSLAREIEDLRNR